MTTSFTPHPEAPTVARPRLTFAQVPRVAAATPTWKGGWVVSGLAAVLAVAALGAVGGVAFGRMTSSHPAAEPAAMSAPVAPAPVLSAPAVTAAPIPTPPDPARTAGQTRIVGTTQIVVVPAPIAAPAQSEPVVPVADPVVTPPEPVTPPAPPEPITSPAPPLGIGTCDLVACQPIPSRTGG